MNYKKRSVNIPGWEMYQVDTLGNVYGQDGRKLKFSLNHNGYCIVNFNHNHKRKGFAIHTLIANTFLQGKTEHRNQINHKDGNKQNNALDNLEWVTPKENVRHAMTILGHNKMGKNNPNAKKVIGYDKITNEKIYEFDSLADASRYFVKPNHNPRYIQTIIYRVIHHKDKKSYHGCIWRYENDGTLAQ